MRTTSKLLGVVCAGWVALSLGAPHAGATTSDHADSRWSSSESSHQSYEPEHESNDFDLGLVKDWFDGLDKHKEDGCDNQCDHEDKKWEHKDDGCDWCNHDKGHDGDWNGHDGDKSEHDGDDWNGHNGDDKWEHEGDRKWDDHDGCDSKCDHGGDDWKQGGKDDECHDRCDQDGKEPVKVIVIVKPFPEKGHEDGCESKCDHDSGDWNKGDDEWNKGGDNCDPCEHDGTWNDGGDTWENSDHGKWDDCEKDECHSSDCDQHDRCDRSDCEHQSDCEHSDRCPDDCQKDDCQDGGPFGGPHMQIPVVGGLLG